MRALLALDEFLPIMYGAHPNREWSAHFSDGQKLRAYALYPVVVEPERYTHQAGYISDTEASPIASTKTNATLSIDIDQNNVIGECPLKSRVARRRMAKRKNKICGTPLLYYDVRLTSQECRYLFVFKPMNLTD